MKLDTPLIRRLGRRIGRPAPLVTLAILLASPAVLARQSVTAEDIERQAAIAAGMESVPFQINAQSALRTESAGGTESGMWVGSPVKIPTDQEEILHPNALLSRQYSEIGERGPGTSVTLLLVHCSDVRDMDGHWPLHCYPKSGWKLEDFKQGVPVRSPEGVPHNFAWSRFSIADGGASPRQMTVFFTFILPDGRIEMDMKAVGDRSTRKSESAKGVAQMQFVFGGEVSPDRCAAVAEQLMIGIPRSLRERLGMPISTQTTDENTNENPASSRSKESGDARSPQS